MEGFSKSQIEGILSVLSVHKHRMDGREVYPLDRAKSFFAEKVCEILHICPSGDDVSEICAESFEQMEAMACGTGAIAAEILEEWWTNVCSNQSWIVN
jgi:hypothetical protein